jgi:hypothetical protein
MAVSPGTLINTYQTCFNDPDDHNIKHNLSEKTEIMTNTNLKAIRKQGWRESAE